MVGQGRHLKICGHDQAGTGGDIIEELMISIKLIGLATADVESQVSGKQLGLRRARNGYHCLIALYHPKQVTLQVGQLGDKCLVSHKAPQLQVFRVCRDSLHRCHYRCPGHNLQATG